MVTTIITQLHFHLYDDFIRRISPPPNGDLNLGSILKGFDSSSLSDPLGKTQTIEVPSSQLWPIDKPFEIGGVSRSLWELKDSKGNIAWEAIVGSEAGTKSPLLHDCEDKDRFLTVEKLLFRCFIATPEYINKALEIGSVVSYIKRTKREKPVYIVTGLMWAEGATYQERGPRRVRFSFEGSNSFILGIRVRKIWWLENGMRCEDEDRFGATLDDSSARDKDGLKDVEDEVDSETRQPDLKERYESESGGEEEGEEGGEEGEAGEGENHKEKCYWVKRTGDCYHFVWEFYISDDE